MANLLWLPKKHKPIPPCEECEKTGVDYAVKLLEHGDYMIGGTHIFMGKSGNLHCHDPNTYRAEFECSNGHQFSITHQSQCWCQVFGIIDPAEYDIVVYRG